MVSLGAKELKPLLQNVSAEQEQLTGPEMPVARTVSSIKLSYLLPQYNSTPGSTRGQYSHVVQQ